MGDVSTLVLVVHVNGKHYVIRDVNAETQWNQKYALSKTAEVLGAKWSRTRAHALIFAHNWNNSSPAPLGVHEMFIDGRHGPTLDEEGMSIDGSEGGGITNESMGREERGNR